MKQFRQFCFIQFDAYQNGTMTGLLLVEPKRMTFRPSHPQKMVLWFLAPRCASSRDIMYCVLSPGSTIFGERQHYFRRHCLPLNDKVVSQAL